MAMTHIETEEQYQTAMARIEGLLPIVREDTPEDDANCVELVRLSHMVAYYDEKNYPILRDYNITKDLYKPDANI